MFLQESSGSPSHNVQAAPAWQQVSQHRAEPLLWGTHSASPTNTCRDQFTQSFNFPLPRQFKKQKNPNKKTKPQTKTNKKTTTTKIFIYWVAEEEHVQPEELERKQLRRAALHFLAAVRATYLFEWWWLHRNTSAEPKDDSYDVNRGKKQTASVQSIKAAMGHDGGDARLQGETMQQGRMTDEKRKVTKAEQTRKALTG